MVYNEFEGFAEKTGTHTVKNGEILYNSVILNMNGKKYSTPLVSVIGSTSAYFSQGKKGKYFYIKNDDIKKKMSASDALNCPDLTIYAVITEDGEYVFDLKILKDAEEALGKIVRSLYLVFFSQLLLSLMTVFILIGFVGLFYLFFKILPSINRVKEFRKRLNVKRVTQHLSEKGFDLESSLVSKEFGWEEHKD